MPQPVQAGGYTALVSANFTRPADTTAYTAGDAATDSTSAPTALTFSGCGRDHGLSGLIVNARLVDSANQSTKGSFELWLFSSSPTPDNDNAAFTPTDAECRDLVAVIVFDTWYVGDATSGANGNAVSLATGLNRAFKCAANSKDLYGLVVVRNAYTPVSAERFDFTLGIVQD